MAGWAQGDPVMPLSLATCGHCDACRSGRPRKCASALMLGAGYWGGEMLLHAAPETPAVTSVSSRSEPAATQRGHELFLMNCAHCHGDDARGTEEGPDLTKFNKSETRIASVVKNGIKGEMPRFDQKLTDADVQMLIRFIHSLKGRAA